MARRLGPSTGQAARQERVKGVAVHDAARPSRNDRLVEIVDHCTAAKATADQIGNSFLSYLLAMTIQEARSSMRPTLPNLMDGGR